MATSGIKLRQCDPTLELFISTPTRDLLLGGPGKKGFWLEIGSGDQMSDADREPGEGDAAGSKQQQTGAEGQARLNRGSGRSGPGSELVPAWSPAHSTAHHSLIRDDLDQETLVTICFGAALTPGCFDHPCIISS